MTIRKCQLKPCPFCGHQNAYPDWFTDMNGYRSMRVYCPNCTGAGPEIPQHHRSEDALRLMAETEWNRRA